MRLFVALALAGLAIPAACGGGSGTDASGLGGDTGNGGAAGGSSTLPTGGATAGGGSTGAGGSSGSTGAVHDICADLGDTLGMGAAIFGDDGTQWYEQAAAAGVTWTYGYMYASGDPQQDPEGFAWITNYRLDTAEQGDASIPTVTFYRMLNVGRDHGHGGSEAQVVQAMLTDASAVRDYLDDYVALLEILAARSTPTLLHVEPDSWGFMMWAFDGFDGVAGNPDATAVPVALAAAAHPALAGRSFADHAGGLGQALLYLRDRMAPAVRLGWHASNFRVGTHPEVVTGFYASMGRWDVIVTEPPHMTSNGSASWDPSDENNRSNLSWFETVARGTGLPILIWQTYVDDGAPYLGAWPANQDNLTALASRGVAGVLWDANAEGCSYACAGADSLLGYLRAYSSQPLRLPASNPCGK